MEYERQEEEGVVSWHIVLLSANVPVTGVGTNLSLLKKKKKKGLKGADTFRIRTSEKPLQENSGYKVSQVSEKSEGHTVV